MLRRAVARAVPQRRWTSRGEVETEQTSRSTQELDELAEGDYTEQVIKDHFEEKKDDEDEEEMDSIR